MQTPSISHKRHRFAPEIIAHAVWLYVRFNLRLREVEKMLPKRIIPGKLRSDGAAKREVALRPAQQIPMAAFMGGSA